MRPSHIEAILDREFASCASGHHTPVMLWGPPGVGKSQIIAGIADRHAVPLIDIRLSQMEPTDLRGIPFRNGDNVEWSVPALLPDARRHGPAGILFLDEINAAPPTVSAAAYQLILDRRLGEYVIPRGWAIFAAGNRQGDRGVTYAMPAPLANRFTHYEVEPNLDDWVAWALRTGIDERILGFLRFRPDLLRLHIRKVFQWVVTVATDDVEEAGVRQANRRRRRSGALRDCSGLSCRACANRSRRAAWS